MQEMRINLLDRTKEALPAALVHLTGSVIVAALCALLVFGIWYPHPYSSLVGGKELFFLIVIVDVVCGPLLTLIIFSSSKPRAELIRDLSFIVVIQMAALSYGVVSMYKARPVFLAFEGSVFRVVRLPDIDFSTISERSDIHQQISGWGPKLLGVKLVDGASPEFMDSVQLSIQGLHPAFRPKRWVSYDSQRAAVSKVAVPLSNLPSNQPNSEVLIERVIKEYSGQELGYIPLIARHHTDWIVVVLVESAEPIAFLNIDPW